jgi:hypothetical protein
LANADFSISFKFGGLTDKNTEGDMRLFSDWVEALSSLEARPGLLPTTGKHDARAGVESRPQPFKSALVVLQLVYILGLGAVTAQARNVLADAPAQNDTPPPPVLSSEAERVSQIAEQNGEKKFLMVDKVHGEIILFENARPVFSRPVLTGASMGDRVPPQVLSFSGTHPLTLEQKVTPAGRFTVTAEADPEYGRVWTLNEIHGKDWDFAIHQVYMGLAAEHRDARLRSADIADHHITFGCINVEPSTIQVLLRHLPQKGKVPLYILPNDESLVAALFPLREAPSVAKSVAVTATNDHSH